MAEIVKIPEDMQHDLVLAVQDLETAWRKRHRLSVEEVFQRYPSLLQDEVAAIEVIYTEYRLRLEMGDAPRDAEFFERFPQVRDRLKVLFEFNELFEDNPGEETRIPRGTVAEIDSLEVKESATEAPLASAPGLGLFGNYRLLEVLGRGGMGTVYRAEDIHLKKKVAVKILHAHWAEDNETRRRFEKEMELVGSLPPHPNVVQALTAGEVNGAPYLVLEFVAGVDLNRVVERLGPLSVSDGCEIIRQATLGLQHAYEGGVVHRDLKPSNLFLSKSGGVKILDLGLAKFAHEQTGDTATGQLLGTADYVAPEQIESTRDVDIRADLYSLGCTLYKLLTGEPPYADVPQLMQKLKAHAERPFPRLEDSRDDIPSELEQLLQQLVAKHREDRLPTPTALLLALTPLCEGSDLRRLIQGLNLSDSPTGTPAPPHTPAKPRGGTSTPAPVKPKVGSTSTPATREKKARPGSVTQPMPVVHAPARIFSGANVWLWRILGCVLLGMVLALGVGLGSWLSVPPLPVEPGKLVIESGRFPVEVTITQGAHESAVTLVDKVSLQEFDLPPAEDYFVSIVEPGSGELVWKELVRVTSGQQRTIDVAEHLIKAHAKVRDDLPHVLQDSGPVVLADPEAVIARLGQKIAKYLVDEEKLSCIVGDFSLPTAHRNMLPRDQIKVWLKQFLTDSSGIAVVKEEDLPDVKIDGTVSIEDGVGMVRVEVRDQDNNLLVEFSDRMSLPGDVRAAR